MPKTKTKTKTKTKNDKSIPNAEPDLQNKLPV